MQNSLISGDDMRYLVQQTPEALTTIMGQMTSLVQDIADLQNDTDERVATMEKQPWYKKMWMTITGKNKSSKNEIQKNQDKVVGYISEAVSQLYQMNCIDQQVMCSLSNRMNQVYAQVTEVYNEQLQMKEQMAEIMAVQQQTIQALGGFVTKLNEKIESVDNFHMLITEIQQGHYHDESQLYSLCCVLAQLDKRTLEDDRKLNILRDALTQSKIINEDSISIQQYLMDILTLADNKVGVVYLELCNFRNSFPANLFAEMIETYHFLPKMEKMSKNKKTIVQKILDKYDLDAEAAFSLAEMAESFLENKQAILISLANIPQIDTTPNSVPLSVSTNDATEFTGNITNEQIKDRFNQLIDNADFDTAYAYIKPLAEQGYPEAQVDLGLMYQLGWIVGKNDKTAFEWYLKAAEQGYTDGASSVASCYAEGRGIQIDRKKADYWYKKACETGSTNEYFDYADYLFDEERYDEAFVWMKKAADNGDDAAQSRVGLLYEQGIGTREDARKAFTYYQKSAENGYCWGQYHLGQCYENGIGCHKDDDKAFYWYNAAVDNKNSKLYGALGDAKRKLGLCYCFGRGIDEDTEEACRLWTEAYDEEDNKESAYWLGFYYRDIEKDIPEAIEWFEKSAEENDDEYALNCLGEIYRNGIGIKRNLARAYDYFKKAANAGLADAQNYLGLMFANGEHVQQDSWKAVKWYQKAVDQGHTIAKYNLARCYYYGNGVEEDEDYAEYLLQEAADEGFEAARDFLEEHF